MEEAIINNLAEYTTATGSLAADSVDMTGLVLTHGILIERPPEVAPTPLGESGSGVSWLLSAMVLIFVIASFRYHKNSKFFSLMLHDVVEVRERHNAFDDTLRETTFIWLLNLLWIASAGILLYGLIRTPGGGIQISGSDMQSLGICIGMAGAYTLFLTAAYSFVGRLFSDSAKAVLWVKGYLSSQGLEAIVLFPLSVVALCVPGIFGTILIAGGIVFILAKILFIYKGFCIFFTQFASWVLFLYYLCSLELVPIVLTYVSARHLCGLV